MGSAQICRNFIPKISNKTKKNLQKMFENFWRKILGNTKFKKFSAELWIEFHKGNEKCFKSLFSGKFTIRSPNFQLFQRSITQIWAAIITGGTNGSELSFPETNWFGKKYLIFSICDVISVFPPIKKRSGIWEFVKEWTVYMNGDTNVIRRMPFKDEIWFLFVNLEKDLCSSSTSSFLV